MTREQIMNLICIDLKRESARTVEHAEVARMGRYPELAAVWPLWEVTCRLQPLWSLKMCGGRCFIKVNVGQSARIIVPSGSPAEAIRREFLLAQVDEQIPKSNQPN